MKESARLLIALVSIATILAGANAAATPNALRQRAAAAGGDAAIQARDAHPGDLETRSCVPSDCSCEFIDAGLFCGDGLLGCKQGIVYQCSGGKKSCSYGPRKSCKECDKLQC